MDSFGKHDIIINILQPPPTQLLPIIFPGDLLEKYSKTKSVTLQEPSLETKQLSGISSDFK